MAEVGIYLIRCKENNKCYIGQSKNVKTRLSGHKSMLRSGKHSNKSMQKDFDLFREENFEFIKIMDCSDMDFSESPCGNGHFASNPMNKAESELIRKYDSYYNGYNGNIQITFEENGKGFMLQKETDNCFVKNDDGTYSLKEKAECDYSLNHCKSHFIKECNMCRYEVKNESYLFCPMCGNKL